jgi:hypothetical protein
LASIRWCAERASIASGKGSVAGGGLSHRSPGGAESVGDDSGVSVGGGGVGDVVEESVGDGVGLVSVGDGSEVGHASVGEGSTVGLGSVGEGVGVGSVGEGSAVGFGSVGEGVGVGSVGGAVAVGIGSVGEGSVEVGGLSVGVQATVRGDGFWLVVGSLWATARPPRADPKTAVAASIARTT